MSLNIGKVVKVPAEIIKGSVTAIKESPKKSKSWIEPAKKGTSALAGIPIEFGLEYISNLVSDLFGIGNSPILRGILKFGIPAGVGTAFIGLKLPFGELVVTACATSIIVGIAREIMNILGLNVFQGGIAMGDEVDNPVIMNDNFVNYALME